MANETFEYAQAIAAEIAHLEDRWQAVNKQAGVINREMAQAQEKLVALIKSLGKPLVLGDRLYLVEGDGLVMREAAVAGQQQGVGYYDPRQQSVVRWSSLGEREPDGGALVLALPKGARAPVALTYVLDSQVWLTPDGNDVPASGSDLWAPLPGLPRGVPS